MTDFPNLSPNERLILGELYNGARRGLDLVKASGGRLTRRTVYVTLAGMDARGYLRSRQIEDGTTCRWLPLREFFLTPLGRRVFEALEPARHRMNDDEVDGVPPCPECPAGADEPCTVCRRRAEEASWENTLENERQRAEKLTDKKGRAWSERRAYDEDWSAMMNRKG
jgi:DNA-binding PadR family transcriptional regulator